MLDAERPKVMTIEQAERIRNRACTRKTTYGREHAQGYAAVLATTEGPGISAYRCPFCERWHVGHLLSFEGMQDVAMAIRVLAQQ